MIVEKLEDRLLQKSWVRNTKAINKIKALRIQLVKAANNLSLQTNQRLVFSLKTKTHKNTSQT